MQSGHPLLPVSISCVLVGGIVFGMSSCTGDRSGAERIEASGHARHAVHSESLQQAMRKLQTRTKEEVAAEIYTGSPASPKLDEVARSAGLIADTALHIPEMLSGVTLDPDEQSRFVALSKQLEAQARTLQTEARHRNLFGVREAMNRLNATCDACHTAFRF